MNNQHFQPSDQQSHQQPNQRLNQQPNQQPKNVLHFWFPNPHNSTQAAMVRQWDWWFRGGANLDALRPFLPLYEQAIRGELNGWEKEARSRLALIILLDQFSRTFHQGTAQAFAQDSQACALTLQGIEVGHYAALETPWQKTFFLLPLGHSENLSNLDLAVRLTDELAQSAPPEYRELLAFSASQAHAHRDVIAQFGRHPHRNQALKRRSTAEEHEYLMRGQLVHNRPIPSHLSSYL
jgi:uncharacterized protein (DUF924 family)